jgi:hypothetical protein
MSRLYNSAAIVGLAVLFVATYSTLYGLLQSGYLLPQNRPLAAVIFLAVAALTAIAAELFARYFFLKRFSADNAESRKAASRLLRSTGTIRRWRVWAAITTATSIISFFAVML